MSATPNASTFNNEDVNDSENISVESLDCAFTLDEICNTISSMSRHKSCDISGNVADFFIDAKMFIAPYLVTIFNHIFDNGIYPEAWTKGVIVPIHKKGDKTNPSNYRGITLVNVIAKIFSLTLRNRINNWCETEDKLNDAQFGFRDSRSTVDCIYILHTVIQKVLAQKQKLYCAFIDYEKAFDTVIHDALWIKLVQSGISSKMLTMLKSLYANVKACVKDMNTMLYSELFDISLGVKQGEPLSPLLFIMFINDIRDYLDFENLTQNDINKLSLYMLVN